MIQAFARLAPETRGMLAIILAMMLFTLMDSCAKRLLESDYPTIQVIWARYAGQTLLLLAIFGPSLRRRLRTKHLNVQLARSAFLFSATALFFTSLNFMELAETVAVFEVAPLLITVLAALVLGEKVGPRRWTAVFLGLCGALIIIRPGVDLFQPAALLPLGAAACMACYQISTRMLGDADSIWTTMLYTAGIGTIVASLVVPFYFEAPRTLLDAAIMTGFAGSALSGISRWSMRWVRRRHRPWLRSTMRVSSGRSCSASPFSARCRSRSPSSARQSLSVPESMSGTANGSALPNARSDRSRGPR